MKKAKPSYTPKLLKEFDELTAMLHSPHQMTRHEGRFAVNRFVEKHGQKVCDDMFEVLKAKDKKAKKRK